MYFDWYFGSCLMFALCLPLKSWRLKAFFMSTNECWFLWPGMHTFTVSCNFLHYLTYIHQFHFYALCSYSNSLSHIVQILYIFDIVSCNFKLQSDSCFHSRMVRAICNGLIVSTTNLTMILSSRPIPLLYTQVTVPWCFVVCVSNASNVTYVLRLSTYISRILRVLATLVKRWRLRWSCGSIVNETVWTGAEPDL